jgi:NADH-quinone oxidoreductase subunit F
VKYICDVKAFELGGAPEDTLPLTEGQCPVDAALRAAERGAALSCGKGVYCRDGIAQAVLILRDIARDKSRDGDMALLCSLLKNMKRASDCEVSVRVSGLIEELITSYEEEWDRHLYRKQCSAMVCPGFYTVHISPGKCTGCGQCEPLCPAGAIAGQAAYIHVVDNYKCTRCGACFSSCPEDAFIKAGAIKPDVPKEPVPAGAFAAEPARRRRRRGE